MATVKDFVRKPPSEAPGPAHACDDPSLSATEFLYAIYRDPTFPLSVRINAAARLLPLTESVPRPVAPEPRCIVIGGIPTEGTRITTTRINSHSLQTPSATRSALIEIAQRFRSKQRRRRRRGQLTQRRFPPTSLALCCACRGKPRTLRSGGSLRGPQPGRHLASCSL